MVDLSKTIAPKSDQLNADDLIGRTLTIKVTKVSGCPEPQQPIAIYFEGDNVKPYKPCKIMRRVLVYIWGKEGASYVGKSMTLYRDPKVLFGGVATGGIRISHMVGIEGATTLVLAESKASRKPFTVKPLVEPQASPATPSPLKDKYPTLFGIKDGALWLANLESVAKAAMTVEDVAEIGGLSSVMKALKNAPEATRASITAILEAAMARVQEAGGDEPEFGDDTPPDDTREAA